MKPLPSGRPVGGSMLTVTGTMLLSASSVLLDPPMDTDTMATAPTASAMGMDASEEGMVND